MDSQTDDDNCDQNFRDSCYLSQHITNHKPRKNCTTTINNKESSSNYNEHWRHDSDMIDKKSKLEPHLNQHPMKNFCDSRKYSYPAHNKILMVQRSRYHIINGKSYACKICNEVFLVKQLLAEHWSTHQKKGKIDCPLCGKTLSPLGLFREDWKMHAGQWIQSCFKCGELFEDDVSFKSHMKLHANETINQCLPCNKVFFTDQGLINHAKTHCEPLTLTAHNMKDLPPLTLPAHNMKDLPKTYACSICKKDSILRTNLEVHMEVHAGQQPQQQQQQQQQQLVKSCTSSVQKMKDSVVSLSFIPDTKSSTNALLSDSCTDISSKGEKVPSPSASNCSQESGLTKFLASQV